jgi:mRNA-degrading endonuclease RelE of RelBE toxin-antitoxin system
MGEEKRFEILIENRVTKRAKKLHKNYRKSIFEAINNLCENPVPQNAIRLKGVLEGFRIRVSDYRFLYIVDFEEKLIVVYLLMHRSEGYPKRMPSISY